MKRIVRLTEGDLHRIVKRSVNRILRESEIDGDKNFDDAGFVNSISKFCENPVDMNNYEPSDEDIYGALGEFNPDDLDTDFSDLMSYNQQNESRRRMSRIIKESIRKVLREHMEWFNDGYVSDVDGFNKNMKKFKPVDMDNYDPNDDEIIDAWNDINPDELDTDFSDLMSNNGNRNESRKRMSRIIKESIRNVLKEASVYPGYDSTTTADIADNGGGNIDGGNIITCYGSPGVINGKYQGSGAGTILGPGVIYLSCNPPSREMTRMYGQLVPVKVDVSNFYRAKDAWEARKMIGLVGFKDEYSGILYHGNRDGDVCAVFDRSCIIG